MPDARSSAGAIGLMQLMPATAKQTARRHGVKYASSQQLTDPETNIQLGTAYLGTMLRRFNNNRILASAAYNAGPSRVERWINPDLPLDVWIETLPFEETRSYVQNVLMFSSIYAWRLNQTPPLIMPNEWKDFSSSNSAFLDSASPDTGPAEPEDRQRAGSTDPAAQLSPVRA